MLLTHTSGETGDVDLRDPWGLDRADRAEGIHRALTTPLESSPGAAFPLLRHQLHSARRADRAGHGRGRRRLRSADTYSRRLAWKRRAIFLRPKRVVRTRMRGAAIAWAPAATGRVLDACPAGSWSTDLLSRIAPTARDEEGRADPSRNPDLDYLLRGTVHDTTARRMGGVAGHAGVFSTAHDVGIYAQALLDRLAGRPSSFPLQQATLELMTTPQQPGHTAEQLQAANDAAREALAKRPNTTNPLLAPTLSGDQGTKPARLRLGYRYAPFHAARHGLSHR